MDKIQAQLDQVLGLGLHRTVSTDSIVSLAGSTNTKKAYKQFIKDLLAIGVTADMINEKGKEIQDIFKPQHPAASNQIDDGDLNQLPEVGKDTLSSYHYKPTNSSDHLLPSGLHPFFNLEVFSISYYSVNTCPLGMKAEVITVGNTPREAWINQVVTRHGIVIIVG